MAWGPVGLGHNHFQDRDRQMAKRIRTDGGAGVSGQNGACPKPGLILPVEIWGLILRRLPEWRWACRLVCKDWRDILNKPHERKTDIWSAFQVAVSRSR